MVEFDGQLTELQQLQYDTIITESENGILNKLTPFTLFIVDASCKPPFFKPITNEESCMVDLTTWYCTIAVLWIPPPVNKCSN